MHIIYIRRNPAVGPFESHQKAEEYLRKEGWNPSPVDGWRRVKPEKDWFQKGQAEYDEAHIQPLKAPY